MGKESRAKKISSMGRKERGFKFPMMQSPYSGSHDFQTKKNTRNSNPLEWKLWRSFGPLESTQQGISGSCCRSMEISGEEEKKSTPEYTVRNFTCFKAYFTQIISRFQPTRSLGGLLAGPADLLRPVPPAAVKACPPPSAGDRGRGIL